MSSSSSSFSDEHLPISEAPTRDGQEISASDDGSWNLGMKFPTGSGSHDGETRSYDAPERIGDYRLRGLIGSGGMGNVYLAEHVRMQRMVAIKMLPLERMNKKESVERFYAEVRAASSLLHPNIVTAFDAGEVDAEGFGDVHYFAMEYVDGMTLTQTIANSGPMTVGEAAAAIRQAAIGLLHAHRAGIVHRDVKPGNLMRTSDGTVKVLDLGLAHVHSTNLTNSTQDAANSGDKKKPSSRGRLVGTLPFMSPEQLEDPDRVDSRSDIYSLGATMYFLLTAKPPYVGEYLDQVYGHRHGEIPDLMQARDDVDLNFANIFRRMMAKSPGQRYASLDEVIDDLGEYASESETPNWLIEFSQRHTGNDASTVSGDSTSGGTARVFGIDLGMFYSATATASPDGELQQLFPGHEEHPLFRMAIADGDPLRFDREAMNLRATHPQLISHCLQLYMGQPTLSRDVAGKRCPPEVVLGLLMRRIYLASWDAGVPPHATAVTVPSSYDQLHRRGIMLAAELAGFSSVRLVDRSIAAVYSLWSHDGANPNSFDDANDDSHLDEPSAGIVSLEKSNEEYILFVGVTGQATEVAIIRRSSSRLEQVATTGHWHGGTLPWLHRLVDLANRTFSERYDVNPKKSAKTAAALQIACEKAMNSMLLLEQTTVTLQINDQSLSVTLDRGTWLESCHDLMEATAKFVRQCCRDAAIKPAAIDQCVTLGAVLRMPAVRKQILPSTIDDKKLVPIDRADVARGAATCLASELPGRGNVAMPPRGVTSQTIGIVIEDAKGRRRILPIIPVGTTLPARTNRRLTCSPERNSMTISIVESSGTDRKEWHSLGRYQIDMANIEGNLRTREISFEVNVNGLLTVRAPLPLAAANSSSGAIHGSTKLPPLPALSITDQEKPQWKQWVEDYSK